MKKINIDHLDVNATILSLMLENTALINTLADVLAELKSKQDNTTVEYAADSINESYKVHYNRLLELHNIK
jgi:hypothetical protein